MNLVKSNEVNNAGKIGLRPRGIYSDSATYDTLDFVYYGSASYVAKQLTVGNTPAENNEYWQILARGDNNDVVIGDETVEFAEATTRANIFSGEALKTMLGKIKKWYTDFKTVAFTGSYNDLINKPTIPSVGNGTLTIQKNGSNVKTFTANQSSNVTANITVPTSAADVGAVATSKVLTTKEQINANTDSSNVAGATAVKAMVSEINSNIANKLKVVTILNVSTRNVGAEYTANNKANNFTYFIPILTWRRGAVVAKQDYDSTYDIVTADIPLVDSSICVIRHATFLINKTTGAVKIEKLNQANLQSDGNFIFSANSMDVGLLGISW